ncbi:hypothetical protein E2562_025682 [Oryza meyeriana var. granulata]|uniref:Uncharacterized protein n=1 Tax=Oryza meyeriana var. granulata TaxID=110450 RepID=A0A6G1FCH6_9ORYZ|nr:hypothetical protein E2562_025682 [Oryza meyeriana var. granulata]
MSKKNNLAKRKKQHEFDLQREKEAKEKLAKKLQAKKSKMKIDGGDTKRKGGKFKVGKKKVKTKLSALAKAKSAQAMEVDNDKMSKLPWHMYSIKLYSIGIIGCPVNSSTCENVMVT